MHIMALFVEEHLGRMGESYVASDVKVTNLIPRCSHPYRRQERAGSMRRGCRLGRRRRTMLDGAVCVSRKGDTEGLLTFNCLAGMTLVETTRGYLPQLR